MLDEKPLGSVHSANVGHFVLQALILLFHTGEPGGYGNQKLYRSIERFSGHRPGKSQHSPVFHLCGNSLILFLFRQQQDTHGALRQLQGKLHAAAVRQRRIDDYNIRW